MAGGAFVADGGGGRNYEGGVTSFVIITCLVAAMGGLLFGYDLGISGGVTSMEEFLTKFFPEVERQMHKPMHETAYCKFDNQLLQLFTSSLYLAALVASFIASKVTRSMGRKISMFIGGLAFLIGALINAFAINVLMLIVGRLLLGVGVGFANQSTPVYLSEMAPDTPNSMLERGKYEEAREMLQKVRGTPNVDAEFQDLCDAVEAAKRVEYPWSKIRERRYRPQLVFCTLIPLFQQITGINVIMFYAPVLFKTLGFKDDASLISAVITGVVNVLATIVSILFADRFGRRFLFLQGGSQMIIFICFYVAGFAWSWGPLGWLVPSEICPLEVRPAGQAINVSVNMFFTFVIGQFFLTLLCKMKFFLFYAFAVAVIVMTIFIYVLLPETKGVPIEEMGRVWKQHRFWTRFVPDDAVIGAPQPEDNTKNA